MSKLLIPTALFISATTAIQCLNIGQTATARWVDSTTKEICTWTGTVGVNFGTSPKNGRPYGCNGRCGDSCDGPALGNVYTQNCWSHDICSFFNGASGGLLDKNCGDAFRSAVPDFAGGALAKCGRENPTLPETPPTNQPVCVSSQGSASIGNLALGDSTPSSESDSGGSTGPDGVGSDVSNPVGDGSVVFNSVGDWSDVSDPVGDGSEGSSDFSPSGDGSDGFDPNGDGGDGGDAGFGSIASGEGDSEIGFRRRFRRY